MTQAGSAIASPTGDFNSLSGEGRRVSMLGGESEEGQGEENLSDPFKFLIMFITTGQRDRGESTPSKAKGHKM